MTSQVIRNSVDQSFRDALKAAREGNRSVLERLCARLYPRVEGLVHQSLAQGGGGRPGHLASVFSTGDVVQDVFWSMIQNLESMHATTEEGVIGYLAMIVRHRLIDMVRFYEADRRRMPRGEGSGHPLSVESGGAGPPTLAMFSEVREKLTDALDEFDERRRLLLRERLSADATFEELAGQLGYPSPDAARKAFYVAQAALLIKLRKVGLSDGKGES